MMKLFIQASLILGILFSVLLVYTVDAIYEQVTYSLLVVMLSMGFYFVKNGWAFWRNSYVIIYVAFYVYSFVYYFIVPSLQGTVFLTLDNNSSFLYTFNAFVFLSILGFFFSEHFVLNNKSVSSETGIEMSLFSLLVCSIIEIIFIYPIMINYALLASAENRIDVQAIITSISFPYIKQLLTAVLIFKTIYFFKKTHNIQFILKVLYVPLYLVSLFLLVKFGMRKELLMICIATIVFYSGKINDKKLMFWLALFVAALLLLGDIRQREADEASVNIINVFGEFFFSHSTLPFIVTNPDIMVSAPIPYLNTLLIFIPKFIAGNSDLTLTLSEIFKKNLSGFDDMGFGFSPLAESYLCSRELGWLIFPAICVFYAGIIKRTFTKSKMLSVVLIAAIPNLMRVDFRSFFIETLVIIVMVGIVSKCSEIKIMSSV